MGELPYTRKGRYGRVTLDHAACGKGYVVEFRPSAATKVVWGKNRVFETFQSFHTALAYFVAHVGVERPVHAPPGRTVRVRHPDALPEFLPAHRAPETVGGG